MAQNRSSAVMAQRRSKLGPGQLDFFPTPPWATRALCELVLAPPHYSAEQTVWEPACGKGDMADTLWSYFSNVVSSDVHDWGYEDALIGDFLDPQILYAAPHWVITNPPYKLALPFAKRALEVAAEGVALLVRLQFLEGLTRHDFFETHPPALVATFAERVPMHQGRLDPKGGSATAYCWLVWQRGDKASRWVRIRRCRRRFERDSDYERYRPPLATAPLLGG